MSTPSVKVQKKNPVDKDIDYCEGTLDKTWGSSISKATFHGDRMVKRKTRVVFGDWMVKGKWSKGRKSRILKN